VVLIFIRRNNNRNKCKFKLIYERKNIRNEWFIKWNTEIRLELLLEIKLDEWNDML